MELRHLRYFIAVAEEGSLTLAAGKRLHTAQPSLSRQMRDLEREVGAQLLTRSVHGIELTAAGRAFLDHARLAVTQADAAKEAARRAAQLIRPSLALGYLSGTEIDLASGLVKPGHEINALGPSLTRPHYLRELTDLMERGRFSGSATSRPGSAASCNG